MKMVSAFAYAYVHLPTESFFIQMNLLCLSYDPFQGHGQAYETFMVEISSIFIHSLLTMGAGK